MIASPLLFNTIHVLSIFINVSDPFICETVTFLAVF